MDRNAKHLMSKHWKKLFGRKINSIEERAGYMSDGVDLLDDSKRPYTEGWLLFRTLLDTFSARRRSRLEAVGVTADQTLWPLAAKWRDAVGTFEQFRERMGIERDPELPENATQHRGIIALVILIDWFLSSYWYGRQQPNALFGMLPAAGPALVTGLVSYGTAVAIRQVYRREWTVRVAGGMLAIVLGLFGVVAHLGASHFRDRYEATGGAILTLANEAESLSERLLSHPFDLSDSGWFMFLMGIVLFGFAILKWIRSDDPFPGYGDKTRAVERASEALNEAFATIQTEVMAAINGTIEEAEAVVHEGREASGRLLNHATQLLRKVGIRDPAKYEISGDEEPGVVELLNRWAEYWEWRSELDAIGDVRSTLQQRKEDDLDPVEIVNLSDALTLDEAMEWLRHEMERFGQMGREEDEDA